MRIDEKRAMALLKLKFVSQPSVIEHSLAVSKKAVEIAKEISKRGTKVNLELVKIGSLLHDIGRSVTHGVEHGYHGGLILRSLGAEDLAKIAERHVGGGIAKEEAERLGLPKEDFIPLSIEEKIVAYADKFFGTTFVFTSKREEDVHRKVISFPTIKPTIEKFKRELGKDHPAVKRLIKLDEEIKSLIEKNLN